MRAREIASSLLQAMQDMPVIDAHEHLPPEHVRVASPVDFATLFGHYTHADLKSAGMSLEDYERFQSPDMALDDKWALFAPFWERIRFMSYARPALIAAREFYDCDDITVDTYRVLSERMQAANTPGIYRRVLREKCHIKVCLTQIGVIPDADRDLLVPLLPLWNWANVGALTEGLREGRWTSLDDYLGAMREGIEAWKRDGVVGLKMHSAELPDPTPEAARAAFEAIQGDALGRDTSALGPFLVHEALRLAGELDLVVAVHCGIIWDNWNDFYTTHPRNMVPILLKHRNTRFDLYHAGIPWPREVGVIAKDFPNAYLNLCWCHIISPRMTVSLLDEWLDLVPVNKILGFGGDYGRPVEKVLGHLQMAKQDIARVLAGRIADGLMTEAQALGVAQRLLQDNARDLYGLGV